MKNESGKAKAILITVISILIIALIAVLVIFKIKGNGNSDKNGESNEKNSGYSDTMSYIETTDKDYVFIDSNANVRKIKKDSFDKIVNNLNEGDVIYNNSLLVKKNDNYMIVDFNGKKLFESREYIERLTQSKDGTIYQYREDGKYGLLNAKGEVLVKPEEYDELFESLESKLDPYVYTADYSSDSTGYDLVIFDKDGKKAYEGVVDSDSLFGNKCGKTRSGVNLIAIRKDKTTITVVNLNTGEEFNTITDNNDHAIEISIKGNVAEITSYARGTYGANQGDEIKTYYWFGEDGKVSKTLKLADGESLNLWNGSSEEEYTIYRNANNENFAINKYGKEIYKSTNSLSQVQYTNEITGVTTSYLVENLGNKSYKTIKSDGTVLFEDKGVGVVGNKYVSSGTTIYKHDGTQYMENLKGYKSLYNLDIIKTEDKYIIENQEGKSIEKDLEFDLGKEARLLDDNTVVLMNNKKINIVNMNDLSMKELDFSDASYVFVKKGYISVSGKDSGYEYYNANGDKIYTKSKK